MFALSPRGPKKVGDTSPNRWENTFVFCLCWYLRGGDEDNEGDDDDADPDMPFCFENVTLNVGLKADWV